MATVDLSHVQFWQPPLNLSSSKQRPASHIRKNSRSGLATNSRNQPVLLHNKSDKILRRDCAFQHEDDKAGAQGTMRENPRNELV
jgi:hypothetical protein